MAKFCGEVGYITTKETEPGIWVEESKEITYYGDLVRNTSKYQPSGGINDNITINNNISIIADPYAMENFQYMRYVKFMGTKWKIESIDVQYPRIVLNVGGLYNG